MVIVPKVMGIVIWSPTVQSSDKLSGIRFCELLTEKYALSIFDLFMPGTANQLLVVLFIILRVLGACRSSVASERCTNIVAIFFSFPHCSCVGWGVATPLWSMTAVEHKIDPTRPLQQQTIVPKKVHVPGALESSSSLIRLCRWCVNLSLLSWMAVFAWEMARARTPL